jgi:hypothetical protein
MRSEEEIKANLEETSSELQEAQKWANNAHDKYYKDKKDWGEADPGEMYAANNVVAVLTGQVNMLKWVLE